MCKYLEEEGADFNLLNHWGHGVVVKAVWKGHLKVLEYLLSLEGVGQQVRFFKFIFCFVFSTHSLFYLFFCIFRCF